MYIILIIALLLILSYGITGITSLLFIMISVLSVGIIFDKQKRKFIYLFFILPWVLIMPGELYYLLIVVYLSALLINHFRKGKGVLLSNLISAVLFLLIVFLSIYKLDVIEIPLLIFFYVNLGVFIVSVLIGIQVEIKDVVHVFSLSLFIACISALSIDKFKYFSLESRFGGNEYNLNDVLIGFSFSRFTGLDNDPNFFSFNVLMAISGILVLLFYEVNKKYRLFYIMLVLILSVFGFLSFSNTFLIGWCLCALIFLFVMNRGKNKIYYITGTLIIIIVCTLGFLLFSEAYYARGEKINLKGGGALTVLTNGREDIWKSYLAGWIQTFTGFLFGNGVMSRVETYTSHNVLIRFLYMFGIIGLASFLFMINSYYKKLKLEKMRIRSIVNFIPLLVFVIFGMMLDLFRGNSLYYLFPYMVLLINFPFYCNENTK